MKLNFYLASKDIPVNKKELETNIDLFQMRDILQMNYSDKLIRKYLEYYWSKNVVDLWKMYYYMNITLSTQDEKINLKVSLDHMKRNKCIFKGLVVFMKSILDKKEIKSVLMTISTIDLVRRIDPIIRGRGVYVANATTYIDKPIILTEKLEKELKEEHIRMRRVRTSWRHWRSKIIRNIYRRDDRKIVSF